MIFLGNPQFQEGSLYARIKSNQVFVVTEVAKKDHSVVNGSPKIIFEFRAQLSALKPWECREHLAAHPGLIYEHHGKALLTLLFVFLSTLAFCVH